MSGELDRIERDLDLEALERNYARIRDRIPPGTKLIGAVKADAYGHGLHEVVGTLDGLGMETVATASVRDALELRRARYRCRILLFAGGYQPSEAPELAEHGIMVTVADAQTARAFMRRRGTRVEVFVKVDCGLGRLGLAPEETEARLRQMALMPGLSLNGIYTHLPFADGAGESWARGRLDTFRRLLQLLRAAGFQFETVQALSSPGVSAALPLSGNAVCCGRLLYGLTPTVGYASTWGLEPVLRALGTRITHVHTYRRDAWIGGGGRHPVRAGETVAVIPFGRSDGNLVRSAPGPCVVHDGRRVPVISVSLEHATLNLGRQSAEVGDEVTILGGDGPAVTLDELAHWSDLEPLDALVALGRGQLSGAATPALSA